jgi:hypothetical protein
MFVVPAQCMTTWINEMHASVNFERTQSFHFNLKVAHTEAKGTYKLDPIDYQQLMTKSNGEAKGGRSSTFVLTTSCSEGRLVTPIASG